MKINRRQAVGALASGFPALLRGARRRAGDKPNLLFLWTDEQRADTLSVYGNHRFRMPALHRLARECVVFDRCYDTQPVCTPARSSVLTGQWPHANGCITNNIPLRRDTPALPELLGDSAYRTAYMGKWHLGDELFAQHGFQEWVAIEDGYNQHFYPDRDKNAKSDYHAFLANLGYQPDARSGRYSRQFAVRRPIEHCKPAFLAGRAADFIHRHRAAPWMLYVNFLEPHMPFYGPLNELHSEDEAPVPANYPGAPIEREPERYVRLRQRYREQGFEGHDLKTRAGWQRLNRNYAGLCSQVDQAIGRILWMLESTGQADNTILVFTSDHGEMMGSHGLIGKGVLYEEACRVPLLLRVPFRRHGLVPVTQPVSQIDLVPTLLDLLGKRPPESLPGQTLTPLLEENQLREDHVFIEWHTPPDGPNARAVISPEGWKLGLYDTDNCLLFQRHRDPLEMENLYYRSDSAAVIRRLRAQIEAWQQRTGDRQPLPAT
jgi:arylsulfatase A-like enzyme